MMATKQPNGQFDDSGEASDTLQNCLNARVHRQAASGQKKSFKIVGDFL